MARPRRPFSGQETITLRDAEWYEDDVKQGVPGTRQSERWKASRHWFVKQPNRLNDPLTCMFIVDALLRIDPSIELRAGALATWLTEKYPMAFDSVTTGRILKDLADIMDVLPDEQRFLEFGRDWRGSFYMLKPGDWSVALLRGVREDLYRLAEDEMKSLLVGGSVNRIGSPFLEVASLRGEFRG